MRHEANRKYSLTMRTFDNLHYISDCGFYYQPNEKRIYCFSCNFNVRYCKKYSNLLELHQKWGEECKFLYDLDLSIPTPDFYNQEKLAAPRIDDRAVLNQVPEIRSVSTLEINPPLRTVYKSRTKGIRLNDFDSPMPIPYVSTDRSVLDIDNYFFMLRSSEDIRRQTFNLPGYKFPYSAELRGKICKAGFFYTFYNSVVQCAFCRLIIKVRGLSTDIEQIHRVFSPNCEFILNNDFLRDHRDNSSESGLSDTNALEVGANVEVPLNYISPEARCVICWTDIRQIFSSPCMHLTFCLSCYGKCKNLANCVICRTKVIEYHKIFVT
jgi:hypothetical protein